MSTPRNFSKSGQTGNSSKSRSKQSTRESSSFFSQSGGEIDLKQLGAPQDVDDATTIIKSWIEEIIEKPEATWRPLWGIKFTEGSKKEGIRNLGRVIGEEYILGSASGEEKVTVLASYRVDWDNVKGRHLNPEIQLQNKTRQRYAFRFGNLIEDSERDASSGKCIGEIGIINQMLSLTNDALLKEQWMSPKEAKKILRNFEIELKSNRSYFKEFSTLLRPLIETAHAVILDSREYKDDTSYYFDPAKLASQVMHDLFDVWSPIVELYLSQIKELPDEQLDIIAANIFLSECIYAGSKKTYSDSVMNQIANFFMNKENDVIKTLFNNLKEYIPTDDRDKIKTVYINLLKYKDHSPASKNAVVKPIAIHGAQTQLFSTPIEDKTSGSNNNKAEDGTNQNTTKVTKPTGR